MEGDQAAVCETCKSVCLFVGGTLCVTYVCMCLTFTEIKKKKIAVKMSMVNQLYLTVGKKKKT